MGKALEAVICDRLLTETVDKRSPNQFGFVKNKSTYSALSALLEWHDSRAEKHILATFLDITGAFDYLKWDILHADLQ